MQAMLIRISLLGLLLVAPWTWAQYRCVDNGKIVYTDRPCANELSTSRGEPPPAKVVGDPSNAAYSTPTGAWRGQAQFQSNVGGAVATEAHAVVPMTIEIDPQGKVIGASPENGCRLLGVASPGILPTMANLDITFSGCRYAGFNRRMSGSLSVYQAQKHAQFQLNSFMVAPGRVAATYDIRATMRR